MMSEVVPVLPFKILSSEVVPGKNSHVTCLRTVLQDAADNQWVFDPSVLNIELKPYVEPRGRYWLLDAGDEHQGPVYRSVEDGQRHPGCYNCGLPLREHRESSTGKRRGCPPDYEAILKEILVDPPVHE
jgi:hypothetical protein